METHDPDSSTIEFSEWIRPKLVRITFDQTSYISQKTGGAADNEISTPQ